MSTESGKPFNIVEQVQRRSVIQSLDSLSKFDVDELAGNIYGIKKLNEEKLVAVAQTFFLQDRVDQLENGFKHLQIENERLKVEINQANQRGLPLFLTSLLATIIMGVGVNVLTSNTNQLLGLLLIILALFGEMIVFLLRPKGGKDE